MIPGLDLGEVSGWGAFGTLAVFVVVGVLRENIVPGRAYRRVLARAEASDQTIAAQARALDAQRPVSEAATRLMTTPIASDTPGGSDAA